MNESNMRTVLCKALFMWCWTAGFKYIQCRSSKNKLCAVWHKSHTVHVAIMFTKTTVPVKQAIAQIPRFRINTSVQRVSSILKI